MFFSRTPFRISLFGGGSDYPAWYEENGGRVLGMAIDKYCYISIRELPPFFEFRHRIVHSKIELVNALDEIQHPAVRAVLEHFPPEMGLQIHHDGDLPARSGLGSSSSFVVGLINLVSNFYGTPRSKPDLARNAIHLERDVMREHVGSQDQVWAAFGGFNRLEFASGDEISVQPMNIDVGRREELLGNLMLFFSGYYRFASEVAEKKIANLSMRHAQIERMMEMVDEAEQVMVSPSRPLSEIGHLLHDSWRLKRELADEVSTPALDQFMEAARDAGALGGKVLGAGGGGFMLFYVEPEHRDSVRKRFDKLIEVDFDIDEQGSTVFSGGSVSGVAN
jgi:D-glycero-alpha-D-manno-heptose-7-phosphate kinase